MSRGFPHDAVLKLYHAVLNRYDKLSPLTRPLYIVNFAENKG